MAHLGDPQPDDSRPCLPVAVAVAVALVDPFGAAFAGRRAAERFGLQRHQTLGGEADQCRWSTRVGLEDGNQLANGAITASNAALTAAAVEVFRNTAGLCRPASRL